MAEPQVPGTISGTITEGSPFEVIPGARPNWTEGPTPNLQPYNGVTGNPAFNPAVPQQRNYRRSGEWRW